MAKFLDVKVRVNTNGLRSKLNRKRSLIDSIPKQAYKFFLGVTPIGRPFTWKNPNPPAGYRPGNARRSTSLKGNVIHANYPYAKRLDTGWSKQALIGMTKPTVDYIKQLYRKLMRIK